MSILETFFLLLFAVRSDADKYTISDITIKLL